MTNSKLIVGMMCVICAMPVWAEPGRTRDFRANDVYSGRDEQNVVRDEQQQRPRNEIAPERNEGFGYGFERRQQQMDMHGNGGRRGRN